MPQSAARPHRKGAFLLQSHGLPGEVLAHFIHLYSSHEVENLASDLWCADAARRSVAVQSFQVKALTVQKPHSQERTFWDVTGARQ